MHVVVEILPMWWSRLQVRESVQLGVVSCLERSINGVRRTRVTLLPKPVMGTQKGGIEDRRTVYE